MNSTVTLLNAYYNLLPYMQRMPTDGLRYTNVNEQIGEVEISFFRFRGNALTLHNAVNPPIYKQVALWSRAEQKWRHTVFVRSGMLVLFTITPARLCLAAVTPISTT
jgi:hypothetical protein